MSTARKKSLMGILLMLFSALCLCSGQLVWKLMPDLQILYIFGGFVIYGIGAIAMMVAYRHGELSVLQPINSVSYVFSLVPSIVILHEEISLSKFVGVFIIVAGIFFIGNGGRE